jgi:LPS export ABC transporter protein LptC
MILKKTHLISCVICIIFLSGGLLLWRQPWRKPPSPLKKPVAPTVDQNMLLGMVIKIPGSDRHSYWELKVDRFAEQNKVGVMTKIKGVYFQNGQPFYHVTAQSGEINWHSRQLRFCNQVEFSSEDGKKLQARECLWDPVRKVVTAAGEVVLSAPGFTVSTEKITANLELEKANFSGLTKVVHQSLR